MSGILEPFSHEAQVIMQDVGVTQVEMQRPFVLLRPTMARDGNKWICVYGGDIHQGVVGIGDTPDEASRNFDENWNSQKITE